MTAPPSDQHPQFLVIDDHAEGRYLLVKTLMRKFPKALVQECQTADVATAAARRGAVSAIVVHRSEDLDAVSLIRQLRAANATVAIVAVSGIDRTQAVLAAGATVFLNYDEWLRIGSVVADLLAASEPETPVAS